MTKLPLIVAVFNVLLTATTVHVNGDGSVEITRAELERSLSSPKISDDLKLTFLDSEEVDSERASIMIEFTGGNSKAIKDFKIDSITSRGASITRGEKISALVDQLQDHATNSQSDVIEFLKSEGADHVPLWAANEIYVKDADSRIVSEIASRFGNVARIRPSGRIKPPKPIKPAKTNRPGNFQSILSNDIPQPLKQMDARCTDIRCLGEGATVAIIDSGVLWTHVELKDNYRHEFGWYDPVNGTELPTFAFAHGTHVAGIIVGKTKGVAPKAKWIACKCFRIDVSEEVYLKACAEWALCPFRWNDTSDRDCSMAPDVINNSWNVNNDEQQAIPRDFFYGLQEAWNAAGIISFFAAGNAGPYCTTVDPPAMYDISFSIAAVDNTSTAAWWSSRGPALDTEFGRPSQNTEYGWGAEDSKVRTCKKQCSHYEEEVCTITKPDLSAPGVKINSSYIESNNSYIQFSGTSMATPMVSGVALLMVCANNRVIGNSKLNQTVATHILKKTATHKRIDLVQGHVDPSLPNNLAKTSNQLCNVAFGNICGTYPNNIYGWGEVDACSAVKAAKKPSFSQGIYNYF